MNKSKPNIVTIVSLILLVCILSLGYLFYTKSLAEKHRREELKIKSDCANSATASYNYQFSHVGPLNLAVNPDAPQQTYDEYYKRCLNEHGL